MFIIFNKARLVLRPWPFLLVASKNCLSKSVLFPPVPVIKHNSSLLTPQEINLDLNELVVFILNHFFNPSVGSLGLTLNGLDSILLLRFAFTFLISRQHLY